MGNEDDKSTTPPPEPRAPGIKTQVASGIKEAVEEQREQDKLDRIVELLEGLNDEKAIQFAREDRKTKRAEACTKIAINLVQPAAMKYYAGIVAMVVAGYMGLSLSGYGVTVGAGDCPTPEHKALSVPSDAP